MVYNSHDFDETTRVLKGIHGLLSDADYLMKDSRYKRALFLVFTAFDELHKVDELLKGVRIGRNVKHFDKYQIINKAASEASTVMLNKIRMQLPEGEVEAAIGIYSESIQKFLRNAFESAKNGSRIYELDIEHFSQLRNMCLYEDVTLSRTEYQESYFEMRCKSFFEIAAFMAQRLKNNVQEQFGPPKR